MYSSKEEVGSFLFILPFTFSNSMILFLNAKAERGKKIWIRVTASRGEVPLRGVLHGGHVSGTPSLTT